MIGIRSLYVNTYDLNSLTIEWEYEIQPPGVDLTSTTVDIQRSETDDFSEFTTISAGLNANNVTSYTDSNLDGIVTQRYKDVNYRLRFVEADGTETISNIVWLTEPTNLVAKDIIRRKNKVLNLRGLTCYYLKKKNFGQLCTDCYDEIMDVQTEGNCATCYNTRFVGGYYPAIRFKAFLTQTPDINIINRFGEFNPGQMVCSIASFPKLATNDIVVDNLNRRWWIMQVVNTSFRGYTVAQDATMNLIDHGDISYNITIP